MKIKIGFTICLAITLSGAGFGQQVINSTGGYSASANLQVEYAIGETAVVAFGENDLWINEGVLQPVLTTVTSSNEIGEIAYQIKVYPNPVTDYLYIETDFQGFDIIAVYNEGGQLIQSEHWNGRYLDMRRMTAGVYLLELKSGFHTFRSLKIIKP